MIFFNPIHLRNTSYAKICNCGQNRRALVLFFVLIVIHASYIPAQDFAVGVLRDNLKIIWGEGSHGLGAENISSSGHGSF